jgi:uncharacterized protein (UPF0548 family)
MRARLKRPIDATLDAIQATARLRPVTYPECGATFDAELPDRYFHDRISVVLGRGDDVFVAACGALRSWSAHHGAGCTITPRDAPIALGQVVTVDIPVLGGHVTASCRIVAVVDTPDAFGFAYGTLDDHPERGEESFVVHCAENGEVTFVVTAFSRPREVLAWVALPVVRFLQHRAARGFLSGMVDATTGALSGRPATGS